MNVTDKETKYRQLHMTFDEVFEGYPQIVSAEQEGYVGVYASSRITENNIINTDLSREGLLEQILDRNNLNNAFRKVNPIKEPEALMGWE